MGIPLYVVCFFSFVAFNSLSLIFVNLIVCLSVFLLGLILHGTLQFLDLILLSHVMDVFGYYLFK